MILTPEQRELADGARERANGATKEPWISLDGHEHKDAEGWPLPCIRVGERVLLEFNPHFPSSADGKFIANARQDVPSLCDLVDELEGQLKAERALWQELLILERNASDPALTELQVRMLRERIGDVRSQLEVTMAGARTYAATGLVKKSSAKDP